MKAIVFLADGFEECEGLIVVDILRRAGIETDMASVMGRLVVDSSRNIKVQADVLAEDVDFDAVDLIVLPGGRLGTENLGKSAVVTEKCREFAAACGSHEARTTAACEAVNKTAGADACKSHEGAYVAAKETTAKTVKRVAAICAAPSLLASLGLLDGKRATCHPDFESHMEGALLTGESVATDGNIVTGQGLGASFDFAFELVRALVGEDKVQQIKRSICYKG